jgi:ABC-type multidrug transport system ATPase subunit
MEPVLRVNNLTKKFGKRTVVDNLNLEVYEGDVFGFLGPNGAGKTTTIRMILNLIKSNSGEVFINGLSLEKNFKKAISNISAIVEYPIFYDNISAYNNLKFLKRFRNDIPMDRIDEVIEIVGLRGREKDKVGTYSLGMKQRLGIAACLINTPKLIILDEPTNGLDPQGIVAVRELITRLAKEHHITVFVSSHLLHEIELMCNRVAIIDRGKTVVQGYVSELMNKDVNCIEVVTSQIEDVKGVIEKLDYVKYIKDTEQGIVLELKKGMNPQFIKRMIEDNIEMEFVNNVGKSLESFFLESIGGEK